MDDDSIIKVYTDELIALSQRADMPRLLSSPQFSAKAVSPICGSEVTVALTLKGDATIDAFGFEVEACALTKAVVAILAETAPGKTRAEIAAAGKTMEALLTHAEATPAPGWEKLALLAPVRDYPARHNSLLLPFEAVEKAFKNGAIPL